MSSRPLRFPDRKRPFWLLVALAIALLVSISPQAASERAPGALLAALARDLAALRVHLETPAARPSTGSEAALAFNADLGDGGPAFRARAIETLARASLRRTDRLIHAYDRRDAVAAARDAELLKVRLHELEQHLNRLARAPSPEATAAALPAAEAALDRVELLVASLRRGSARADTAAGRAPGLPGVTAPSS